MSACDTPYALLIAQVLALVAVTVQYVFLK